MAKGKGQSRKRPAVEKKFDGGGSRVNAVNTWDDMEHDSEDDCKRPPLFMFRNEMPWTEAHVHKPD